MARGSVVAPLAADEGIAVRQAIRGLHVRVGVAAVQQHFRAVVMHVADVVRRQRNFQRIVGRCAQDAAQGAVADIAGRVLLALHATDRRTEAAGRVGAAVVEHVDVAVLVGVGARKACRHRLGDLEVTAGAQVDAVAAAVSGRHVAAAVTGGLARHELDGTTFRVAAGERALRAAQHFDALHVHEVEVRTRQAGVVHVVDIHTDARLVSRVEVDLAETTDGGGDGVTERRRSGAQDDAGRAVRDGGQVGGATRLELFTGDRRDGDGRVLQLLLTELGGNDHFTDGAVGGGRVLGLRRESHHASGHG